MTTVDFRNQTSVQLMSQAPPPSTNLIVNACGCALFSMYNHSWSYFCIALSRHVLLSLSYPRPVLYLFL